MEKLASRKRKRNGQRCEARIKGSETAKNAARERSRVRSLREAFQRLQDILPAVPRNTKLSKLDVLILATNYISHLSRLLSQSDPDDEASATNYKYLHPVKKWPMRSRLYAGKDPHETPDELISSELMTINKPLNSVDTQSSTSSSTSSANESNQLEYISPSFSAIDCDHLMLYQNENNYEYIELDLLKLIDLPAEYLLL